MPILIDARLTPLLMDACSDDKRPIVIMVVNINKSNNNDEEWNNALPMKQITNALPHQQHIPASTAASLPCDCPFRLTNARSYGRPFWWTPFRWTPFRWTPFRWTPFQLMPFKHPFWWTERPTNQATTATNNKNKNNKDNDFRSEMQVPPSTIVLLSTPFVLFRWNQQWRQQQGSTNNKTPFRWTPFRWTPFCWTPKRPSAECSNDNADDNNEEEKIALDAHYCWGSLSWSSLLKNIERMPFRWQQRPGFTVAVVVVVVVIVIVNVVVSATTAAATATTAITKETVIRLHQQWWRQRWQQRTKLRRDKEQNHIAVAECCCCCCCRWCLSAGKIMNNLLSMTTPTQCSIKWQPLPLDTLPIDANGHEQNWRVKSV